MKETRITVISNAIHGVEDQLACAVSQMVTAVTVIGLKALKIGTPSQIVRAALAASIALSRILSERVRNIGQRIVSEILFSSMLILELVYIASAYSGKGTKHQ